MRKSINWALLARYLSNECNEKEKRWIQNWIRSKPANERLLKSMEVVWKTPEQQVQKSPIKNLWSKVAYSAGLDASFDEQEKPIVLESVPNRADRSFMFHSRTYRILCYAALLVLAVSISYFVTNGFKMIPWHSRMNSVIVDKGTKTTFVLDDGTSVTLDAGSIFNYPKKFDNDVREVHLIGEGFFEVANNPQKPFIVNAGLAVIQVLGTKFDVEAWEHDQTVHVAVVEGKVTLRSNERSSERTVIITDGMSSTLRKNGLPSEPESIDIEKQIGWIQNRIIIDDAPLNKILYHLERWYDIQFVLADSTVGEEHVTVNIQKKSVEDILELISALTGLDYKRQDNIIYLGQK